MVKQYNSQTNVIFIVIILFIFYFIIKNFNKSTNKSIQHFGINKPNRIRAITNEGTSQKSISKGILSYINNNDQLVTKYANIMVFFDFNEHEINKKNKNMLDKYFSTRGKQYYDICIVGHTDPVGNKEVNTLFGYLRSTAVLYYLNKIGVSTKKFTIMSKDYTDPLHNSDHNYNRRVEIYLR